MRSSVASSKLGSRRERVRVQLVAPSLCAALTHMHCQDLLLVVDMESFGVNLNGPHTKLRPRSLCLGASSSSPDGALPSATAPGASPSMLSMGARRLSSSLSLSLASLLLLELLAPDEDEPEPDEGAPCSSSPSPTH